MVSDPLVLLRSDPSRLLTLCPSQVGSYWHDVVQEVARALVRLERRGPGASWQEAWNDLVGARGGRGVLHLAGVRCPDCHGRGFDVHHVARNYARTGSPYVCAQCRGRRTCDLSFDVAAAPLPQEAPDPPAAADPAR